MKKTGWNLFTIVGLLLILTALLLTAYNIWDTFRASDAAQDVLENVKPLINDSSSAKWDDTPDRSVAEPVPDYVLNPEMDMPIKQYAGRNYVGVLEIPSLELSLTIAEVWDYDNLKVSPCRYSGSVYMDDMIICAHNYPTHFGNIKNLSIGDRVTFTDMDGNSFIYEVSDQEIVQPTDFTGLEDGDWDLTLFTCTIGGSTRVTVRCVRVR